MFFLASTNIYDSVSMAVLACFLIFNMYSCPIFNTSVNFGSTFYLLSHCLAALPHHFKISNTFVPNKSSSVSNLFIQKPSHSTAFSKLLHQVCFRKKKTLCNFYLSKASQKTDRSQRNRVIEGEAVPFYVHLFI